MSEERVQFVLMKVTDPTGREAPEPFRVPDVAGAAIPAVVPASAFAYTNAGGVYDGRRVIEPLVFLWPSYWLNQCGGHQLFRLGKA